MPMLIPLPLTVPETGEVLCPALLADGAHLVLVDCGYPDSLPLIESAMANLGLSPEQLTEVFITHHDDDHMGALARLCARYPQARVVAGEGEARYLTGAQKSLRLYQAEALQPTLPPEARAWGEAFCRRLAAVEPVPVHQTVTDGDLLPWCGGCRVVATPGHTPGHCSLYLPQLRVLVTGDAAVLEAGAPAVANPHFTLDLPQAEASLQKLLALDADCWLCYHGGLLRR